MKSPNEHAHRRAANWLRRQLSILIQGHLRDPALGVVTIIDVDVRRNYSSARIHIDVDVENAEDTLAALNKAAGHLRSKLATSHGGHLRTIPELRFYLDRGARKLDDLFAEIDAEGRAK